MATSSIFTRVRIDNEKDAEAFVDALEKSEKATENEKLTPTYRYITNPDEIRELVAANKKAREKRSNES